MNRDALRSTAHNGCVQPVRGAYGAIRYTPRPKSQGVVWLQSLVLALVLLAGVAAVCLLAAGVLPD